MNHFINQTFDQFITLSIIDFIVSLPCYFVN